jgi:hypothetical protein
METRTAILRSALISMLDCITSVEAVGLAEPEIDRD